MLYLYVFRIWKTLFQNNLGLYILEVHVNYKRWLIADLVVLGVIGSALVFTFVSCRTAIENEWQYKMADGPRSMSQIRGLIDNMYTYRNSTMPAFVPRSGWDDGLCAANIITAITHLN